jgi:hypothetical protein
LRRFHEYTLSRHVIPAIGEKKLTGVTRADIYATMKRWQVDGMGASLQAKCRAVMTSMFEDAVQRGLIQENPARGIKISKQGGRARRVRAERRGAASGSDRAASARRSRRRDRGRQREEVPTSGAQRA